MQASLVSIYTDRIKTLRSMNDAERILSRLAIMLTIICHNGSALTHKLVVLFVGTVCGFWAFSQMLRNREIQIIEREFAKTDDKSENKYIAIENQISYYGRLGMLKTIQSLEPMMWIMICALVYFLHGLKGTLTVK